MRTLTCVAATAALFAGACAEFPRPTMPMIQEPTLFARLRQLCARGPITVAHRGDSGEFPENTLPAFAAAVAAGAPMIELDFHATADEVLVCIHDETLDRTTDAQGVLGRKGVDVRSVRAAQLEGLDAGAWKGPGHRGTRLPTLAEALAAIQPRAITMIEHKAGRAEALVSLLWRLRLVDEVLVQSFDWDFVTRVHELEPRIALGVLGEGPLTEEKVAAIPGTGARLVHWNVRGLRAGDPERLHAAGYLVCVYTANDDVTLVGAAALGVDAITTNHPARLLSLVADGIAARRSR